MTPAISERTPRAWAKECLEILRDISANYSVNREASGRFIEFVRKDSSGLYVSQNFIRIRDDYHLCFGLSFTTRLSRPLKSPLVAGSRFDHNRTIWRQFLDDLGVRRGDSGYPSGIWSFGPWRSNTMENLARGLAVNEQYLYPFYREALKAGRPRLIRLLEAARRLVPVLDSALPVADHTELGVKETPSELSRLASAPISALAIARGGEIYCGFGPQSNTVNLDEIAPEAVILAFNEVFLPERDRLDELLSIAHAL